MENAKPNISPRRGMTPLERAWAAALCASGDAVANMGTDALRLAAAQKPQNVTSAGIMESTHKLARACRIIDVSTASTPAAVGQADYAPPPAGRARIDRPEPCGRAAVRRGKARPAAAGLGQHTGSRRGLRLHDGRGIKLPAQMGEHQPMETRELTDMTAVLRAINDGNPSNAERWVTLTQRVVRAETRANAAERAAARKDWEKQNAEYDSWQSNYRAEVAQQEAAKAQDKAARWEVLALTMAAALVLTLSIAAHQANEAARWRYEAQGMGQTEIVTPQNQNTAVQP